MSKQPNPTTTAMPPQRMAVSDANNIVAQYGTPSAPVPNFTFEQLVRMANAFANSGMFGVKNPDQALALMFYSQALGKHPAIIMRDYHIINNQLAKKAEAMLRDFQKSGGRVEWLEYTDARVVGRFAHPLSPTTITVDWDLDRAKRAQLAGKNGDMYGKFTRAMFRSRVISEGVRTCAPEATDQMYTPDEIAAMQTDTPPESATTHAAVADAVDAATHQMDPDELDALITSMDVGTLVELKRAFASAWTRAKEVGDEAAKSRLQRVYDAQKADLETAAEAVRRETQQGAAK